MRDLPGVVCTFFFGIIFQKGFELNLQYVFLKRVFRNVAMNAFFWSLRQKNISPLVKVATFKTRIKLS